MYHTSAYFNLKKKICVMGCNTEIWVKELNWFTSAYLFVLMIYMTCDVYSFTDSNSSKFELLQVMLLLLTFCKILILTS